MEIVTEEEGSKCLNILSEIESELEIKKSLEGKIKNAETKILALSIAQKRKVCRNEFVKVNVKVFDNVFQIYELYEHEISSGELRKLSILEDKQYYYVTITICKTLLDIIEDKNWILSIRIHNSNMKVMKTIKIYKNITIPIKAIIPFENSIETSYVDVSICFNFETLWSPVKVSSTIIDISYHFRPHEDEEILTLKNVIRSFISKYKNVCILGYSKLEYEFECKYKTEHFFKLIISNSYYKLNKQLLSAFVEQKLAIALDLSTGTNSLKIKLDNQKNCLKIVSNSLEEMRLVKEYIIKNMQCKDIKIDEVWLFNLKNLKNCLRNELCQSRINFENLKIFKEELSKLKFSLPV